MFMAGVFGESFYTLMLGPMLFVKRTDVLRIVKGGVDCHAGGMSLKAENLYGKAIEWLNEILWMSCLADRSFR